MLVFSAVLITIGSVSAQQAFADEGQGTLYATEPYRCELWTIDPSDGSSILIGNTMDGEQYIPLPSLAVDPTSGIMYAGGGGANGSCPDIVDNPNLYIVDPSNGDLEFVGATGEGKLIGLDFSSDGTLYAAVKTSGGPGGGAGGTELGIVNTATGATALVGPFNAAITSLAFFDGTLYGVNYDDELYEINTITGAANLIQSVSPSIPLGATQFECDGTYYGGAGDTGQDDDFGSLDISSGDFTVIGTTSIDETIGGLAFIDTCQNTPDDVCNDVTDGQFPNGIGVIGLDTVLVKCFDAEDPCFADGVPVKSNDPTTCSFAVIAANSFGDTMIVQDTLPSEWEIDIGFGIGSSICVGINANSGTPDNQGKKGDKSATKIECVGPQGEFVGFIVDVQTRESPGKGHKEGTVYKPTSCGTFELNSGATLILGDELGDPVLEEVEEGVFEPIVLAETDPLELEAVGEVCEI